MTDEIYRKMEKRSIQTVYLFGKKLITIPEKHFLEFQDYFDRSLNILNDKENFRTRNRFKHIHAIKENGLVQFHIDYGNPSENILMAIPHLFIDVIPYFLWHLIHFKRPYQFESY